MKRAHISVWPRTGAVLLLALVVWKSSALNRTSILVAVTLAFLLFIPGLVRRYEEYGVLRRKLSKASYTIAVILCATIVWTLGSLVIR